MEELFRGNGVTLRTQKVIQGGDNGHVGRPCQVSPAPPCPELCCELRGLCRHSYFGPRTCGRSEKPMSSKWRGLNPGFQRNLSVSPLMSNRCLVSSIKMLKTVHQRCVMRMRMSTMDVRMRLGLLMIASRSRTRQARTACAMTRRRQPPQPTAWAAIHRRHPLAQVSQGRQKMLRISLRRSGTKGSTRNALRREDHFQHRARVRGVVGRHVD